MVLYPKKRFRGKARIRQLRRELAQEHITSLIQSAFILAVEFRDLEKSLRIARLARRFSIRMDAPMPKPWKYFYCKHCKSFLIPGINARVRIRKKGKRSYITIYCEYCRNYSRIVFKPNKPKKYGY